MAANKGNVTKRADVDRALTHAEGDANFQELINVIDDQQNFEISQQQTNSDLSSLVNSSSSNLTNHLNDSDPHPVLSTKIDDEVESVFTTKGGIGNWDSGRNYDSRAIVISGGQLYQLKVGGDSSVDPSTDDGTNWEGKELSDSVQSIIEAINLNEGQTSITLTNASTNSMQLYIEGAREFDFTVTGQKTFELPESFPTGTRIWVVSAEQYVDANAALVTATGGIAPISLGDRFAQVINLRDFGLIADGESHPLSERFDTLASAQMFYPFVTDLTDEIDWAATQHAFNRASVLTQGEAGGVKIVAPSGAAILNRQAVCTIGVVGTPDYDVPSVDFVGAGSGSTSFVATEDNDEGCISLTSEKNAELWRVEGMSFLSSLASDSSVNNGIGLSVTTSLEPGTAGWGEHRRRSLIIRDVFVGSRGESTSARAFDGNFLKGIYVKGKWFALIENVFVLGTNSPVYPTSGRTHAIHMEYCYSPTLDRCYVLGSYTYGVELLALEDFRFSNSFFVGPNHPLFVTHAEDEATTYLKEPGGSFVNVHANGQNTCVWLRRHRQVIIDGLYVYVSKGTGRDGAVGVQGGLVLEDVDDIVGANLEFLEPGFYVDDDNCSAGIVFKGNRTNAQLSNILINCGGVGVYVLDEDMDGVVRISDITFGGIQTGAWAEEVDFIDNSGILRMRSATTGKGGYEVTATANGSAPSIEMSTFAARSDYASNTGAPLGQYSFYGYNSEKAKVNAVAIRADWEENTSGIEESSITFFTRANGGFFGRHRIRGDGKFQSNGGFATNTGDGATGSFTSSDGKTITVSGGIITGIV